MASCLAMLALNACVGSIGDAPGRAPDGSVPTSPSMPTSPSQPVCHADVRQAGDAPVRRLTRDEYDNTVHDLLGDTTAPARGFPPDSTLGIFTSNVDAPVSALLAQQYLETAERLAATAVQHLDTLVPCSHAGDGDATCARQFVRDFGRRAYRRPLGTDEVDQLVALYSSARTAGDTFALGIQTVLEVMLQSPWFVNHVERGMTTDPAAGATAVALTGYEIAARLSYLLYRSTPDVTLLDAAGAGRLDTADGVAAMAQSMLLDPRARPGLRNFYTEWLALDDVNGADKDATLYPEYDAALAQSMQHETEQYLDDVLWNGDARFETLLTGGFTFVNGPLAQLYGMTGVTGADFQRVRLDGTQRIGLLTQPSFLTIRAHNAQTNPVGRGKFVRQRLLCGEIASPPPDVDTTPPALDPTRTTRERFAEHESNPYCGGCHRMMDPIGLGFEHYDAIGRYRTMENGSPVDATGTIVAQAPVVPADVPFDGAAALSTWLAQSSAARDCLATEWFRYGLGRNEQDADQCSLQAVRDDFGHSHDLRGLVASLVRSDAFRYRQRIVAVTDGECP